MKARSEESIRRLLVGEAALKTEATALNLREALNGSDGRRSQLEGVDPLSVLDVLTLLMLPPAAA